MTINEIAQLAGVSRATVSRYLNDGYVSQEKKGRIKEVIEETGYRPSVQAQMLRNKKTSLIGVVIPKINSESVARMVAGITEVLSDSGYQILLANTFNEEQEELKYLKTFKESHVDGVILFGTVFTQKHRSMLEEIKVPLVILGQNVKGIPCVYHDDYNAAKDVATLLIKSFKEKFNEGNILYMGVTNRDKAAGAEREKGFLSAAKEAGINPDAIMMKECGFSYEKAYQIMREALQESDQIKAVFCATDTIALGAMTSARDHGYEVPADMIFVGMGNYTMAHVIRPKLTTVHYHYKTSGIEAATLLLEMLKQEDSIKKDIQMSYEVLEQDSI